MQKINTTRFRQAEYLNTTWQALAENGMMPEDLLSPDSWGLVASLLKPFDLVRVIADDASWWAEYLVLDANALWAKVRLLRRVDTKEAVESIDGQLPESGDYKIVLRGIKKWSVVRKGDNAIIKEGLATREDADTYLAAHLKAMAA